jgi:hypothetical protein
MSVVQATSRERRKRARMVLVLAVRGRLVMVEGPPS